MPTSVLTHNRDVFKKLFAEAQAIDPVIRSGNMFGCPAVFKGRKMAACVYGDSIGLRVPEDIAVDSIKADRAVAFRPYGKPKMREWIQIDGGTRAITSCLDLLATAIAFAEENNG